MKIVKKELIKGKKILEIGVDAHITDLLNTTEDTASSLIQGFTEDGPFKYFEENLNGKFNITYPLDVIVEGEVEKVFTVGELLWKVAQIYEKIYQEEEETTKIEVGQMSENLINRNQTDGKYGIWGHDIGDLVFEGIVIYDNAVIEFYIGS